MSTTPTPATSDNTSRAPRRRLALRREALRELTIADLRHIAGGQTDWSYRCSDVTIKHDIRELAA